MVVTLVAYYTSRTQMWNDTIARLNQAIVEAYLRRDLLDSHVKRISLQYAAQMNCMLECLGKMKGIQHFTRPEGGLFIFAWLQEGVNATDMLMKAVDRGVAYVPGTYFYPCGGHDNTLRLNFSNSDLPVIKRGMAGLILFTASAPACIVPAQVSYHLFRMFRHFGT